MKITQYILFSFLIITASCSYKNPNSKENICQNSAFSCFEPKAIYQSKTAFYTRYVQFINYSRLKIDTPVIKHIINPITYSILAPGSLISGNYFSLKSKFKKERKLKFKQYGLYGIYVRFPQNNQWFRYLDDNELTPTFYKMNDESTFIKIEYNGDDLRVIFKNENKLTNYINNISYSKEGDSNLDITHSNSKIIDANCMRFDEQFKENSHNYLRENNSLICQHPIYKDRSVTITYSQLLNNNTKLSDTKIDDFFSNIGFAKEYY